MHKRLKPQAPLWYQSGSQLAYPDGINPAKFVLGIKVFAKTQQPVLIGLSGHAAFPLCDMLAVHFKFVSL